MPSGLHGLYSTTHKQATEEDKQWVSMTPSIRDGRSQVINRSERVSELWVNSRSVEFFSNVQIFRELPSVGS